MKNYYEILEIDKRATPKVIKGVYKLHIKENHPDLFQGEERLMAEEKIKKINEAYEVLIDENKRHDYDEMIETQYETELNILKNENEKLKSALQFKEEQCVDGFDKNEPLKYETTGTQDFEYELDGNVTYENNQKYMRKLSQKQFIIKLIMTFCIVIASGIGLYRATGFNLFQVLWNAIIAAFK